MLKISRSLFDVLDSPSLFVALDHALNSLLHLPCLSTPLSRVSASDEEIENTAISECEGEYRGHISGGGALSE